MEDRSSFGRLQGSVSDYNNFNANLIADLRANGGKASAGPFLGRDLLILTTQGAKSGEKRHNPLVYHRDGDRIVIIASKGGAPTHPAWYHNLVANPDVTVEMNGETFPARARTVDDDAEYERLYGQHAEMMPGFNEYRQKTSRRIPVVVLERAAERVG
jgi:deazaflavin-dependent oxidoreductase (nitroreductase family)